MATASTNATAINGANLRAALDASDDFGLEVRVRALLERHGGKVSHGWSYIDPVEVKPRQFDIRCNLCHPRFKTEFELAVECKNLAPDLPLLIVGVGRVREESYHYYVESSVISDSDFLEIRKCEFDNRHYPIGKFVGKSLLRFSAKDGKLAPNRSLETEIYNRWSQALSSAHELCGNAIWANRTIDTPRCTVVLPLIVVPDGVLWTATYDDCGSLSADPVKADDATLFVNHSVELPDRYCPPWKLTHVHVFTLSGFRLFLGNLFDPRNTWETWFPCKPQKVWSGRVERS